MDYSKEYLANYPWRLIKIFKGLIGGKFVLFTEYCSQALFIYDFGNQCKKNPCGTQLGLLRNKFRIFWMNLVLILGKREGFLGGYSINFQQQIRR